jgi:hypothetical protein
MSLGHIQDTERMMQFIGSKTSVSQETLHCALVFDEVEAGAISIIILKKHDMKLHEIHVVKGEGK